MRQSYYWSMRKSFEFTAVMLLFLLFFQCNMKVIYCTNRHVKKTVSRVRFDFYQPNQYGLV